MPISDSDYKILWGRAAGICSNPTCRNDLTVLLEERGTYNIGEMAHIIARRPNGPRGTPEGGADQYGNLILLCPTCHTRIDKAPGGEFPTKLLHAWKQDHENAIRAIGRERQFSNLPQLKQYVSPLLAENKAMWQAFGPSSNAAQADPGSNLHIVWTLRKLDRILPNNRRMINAIEANAALLGRDELAAFIDFKIHASAFESNQYTRFDTYPTFPQRFAVLFSS